MRNLQKGFIVPLLLVIISLLVIAGGVFFYKNKTTEPIVDTSFPKTESTTQPIICTADAKECPDGSYVSRTGQNCEFKACPATIFEGKNCPVYSPPPPGWCANGKIIDGGLNSQGCPNPPKCLE